MLGQTDGPCINCFLRLQLYSKENIIKERYNTRNKIGVNPGYEDVGPYYLKLGVGGLVVTHQN